MGQRIKLPKHVHGFTDRHGRPRYYLRRPGFKNVPLPGLPWSPAFMAAYETGMGGEAPKQEIGAKRTLPGTVNAAVIAYLASASFQSLAHETKRTRKNILERWRREHGDKQIATLEKRHIEQMVQAKARTPSAARNFRNTLSGFLAHCALIGLRRDNPAEGVKRPPIKTAGYKPWPEEYVTAYRNHHPLGTRERLALELLIATGAAKADTSRLGRQHVRNGMFSFRRGKTGVEVDIPVLPEFQAALDAMPRADHLTFIVTAKGQPFTPAGFGNWFRDCCNEAGIPVGYSAHGVRKYAATRHADRGATAHELMSWFGWLTIREAERYTKSAARKKLAIGMREKLVPFPGGDAT